MSTHGKGIKKLPAPTVATGHVKKQKVGAAAAAASRRHQLLMYERGTLGEGRLPTRRLLRFARSVGVNKIRKGLCKSLRARLAERTRTLMHHLLVIADYAGRKTLCPADVQYALLNMGEGRIYGEQV